MYDHVIAQKFNSSQSRSSGNIIFLVIYILSITFTLIKLFVTGDEGDSSQIHLLRMLQILREFSTDQVLSIYVIDDIWEFMDAMKVSCISQTCLLTLIMDVAIATYSLINGSICFMVYPLRVTSKKSSVS